MLSQNLLRAAAAGALVLGLTACGDDGGKKDTNGGAASGASATPTDKVEVKDFAFSPAAITVKAGSTVTWTFKDSADHTVASKTGSSEIKESPELKDGGTYQHTFATAGTFEYHCTIHNSMTGTVVVTAA